MLMKARTMSYHPRRRRKLATHRLLSLMRSHMIAGLTAAELLKVLLFI
jgi:hypothetical protein